MCLIPVSSRVKASAVASSVSPIIARQTMKAIGWCNLLRLTVNCRCTAVERSQQPPDHTNPPSATSSRPPLLSSLNLLPSFNRLSNCSIAILYRILQDSWDQDCLDQMLIDSLDTLEPFEPLVLQLVFLRMFDDSRRFFRVSRMLAEWWWDSPVEWCFERWKYDLFGVSCFTTC